MSFRPTISVYLNGRIIDYGYYRNWRTKYLFYEAAALASFFGDCRTREEYFNRRYGTQRVLYVFEPESFESTEENLMWFEENSEFPIIVDLTEKCIYVRDTEQLLSAQDVQERIALAESNHMLCQKEVLTPIDAEQEDDGEPWRPGSLFRRRYTYIDVPITQISIFSPDEDFSSILNRGLSFAQWDMRVIKALFLECDPAESLLSSELQKRILRLFPAVSAE